MIHVTQATRTRAILAIAPALCLVGLAASVSAQPDESAAEDAAITETVWSVTRHGPSPPATDQSVRFEPDGGLLLSTGCADYTATYVIDGDALSVESLRRELGSITECTFGEMGSADTFVNLMEAAETWTIDEGGQLIVGAGGRYEGTTLTLEPGEDLEPSDEGTSAAGFDSEDLDGTWRLQTMDLGPAGQATMPGEITITLVFTPDGQLSGSGSCSNYDGDYTVIGDATLAVQDVSAAEATDCTPELADLQQLYLGILPVLDAVRFEDGLLVLSSTPLSAELVYEPAG